MLFTILRNLLTSDRRGDVRLPAVASSLRIIHRSAWNLAGKLFEGLPLRLRDEQCGEDSTQHEKSEDLHDVIEPRGSVGLSNMSLCSERSKDSLCDDGTNLAGGCGNTMRGRSVAGRETFAGNDECGCIGSEVEEELSQNVEGQKTVLTQVAVGKSNDDEDYREKSESHQLDRLSSDGVDGCNSNPVTWNGACADDDQVANSGIAEDLVDCITLGITDCGKNDGVVETKTVECNIFQMVSCGAPTGKQLQRETYRGKTRIQQFREEPFRVSTVRSGE